MITPLEISVNAANPAMPLAPLVSFLGSPSSLRLVGVPRAVGSWRITAVAVTVTYPDGSIISKAATFVSGVWVATLDGCATPGSVTGGYTITSDGIDERGEAVSGFVLGRGDVVVLDLDGTVTVGETTYYLHLLAAKPDAPKRGDVYAEEDTLRLYNGAAWVPFAPPVDLTAYATKDEVSAKANKATTLAGYGITDAATKTEVAEEAARAKAAEQENAAAAAAAAAKADTAQSAAESAQSMAEMASRTANDVNESLNLFAVRKDNPHAVTAEQVGAYTKDETDEKLTSKADKATTLAGYGITDAAKQTDLEALAAKVDAANTALEEVA